MVVNAIKSLLTRQTGGNPDNQSFNVTNFAAEIGKNGVANPAYFIVEIHGPNGGLRTKDPGAGFAMPQIEAAFPLRIESAELPGRNLMTHDQMYYGPVRKVPYATQYSPFIFSVILSEDYREREFFYRWQDIFVGNQRNPNWQSVPRIFDGGYYEDATLGSSVSLKCYATSPVFQQPGGSGSQSMFETIVEVGKSVGFNTDAITNPFGLNIFGTKTRKVDTILEVNLIECYPIEITPIPLSWGEEGYGKLRVTMNYRYFTEKPVIVNATSADPSVAKYIRDGVNAFNRFRPIFSVVRGGNAGSAARATARQVYQTQARGPVKTGTGF